MNIAVIPARGGSKRIPRKNVKLFHGLPIISYAINTATKSGIFDKVIVSTDDAEIAEIAKSYGAEIPWMRSKELSGDHVTTISVMQDATKKLGADFVGLENVCCIYPATPLLKTNFLSRGLELLTVGGWNYVFSAVAVESPPYRFFSLTPSNGVKMLFPNFEKSRTQDLESTYCDAGQFYWGTKKSWSAGLPILSMNSTILELPTNLTIDIDTISDWKIAENRYESLRGISIER
jgi:pseudaminic acid cytidylyltransferase